MNAIQLELNIDNRSREDMRLYYMQMQLDAACESMDRTRKKLFAELGQLKKQYADLVRANAELKASLRTEKQEWRYLDNDCLFEISDPLIAMA